MNTIKCRLNKDYSFGTISHDHLILSITTDKRDARRGRILRCDIIRWKDANLEEISIVAETEEDEYELLLALPEYISHAGRIVTYNGLSFDIPFIKRRLKLFGLPEIFTDKEHADMYRELKSLVTFFALPSRRLSDISEFLKMHGGEVQPGAVSVAGRTLEAMAMLHFKKFLGGNYRVEDVRLDGELLIYSLKAKSGFPCSVSVHDGPFHLGFSKDGSAVLSARSYEGMLRFYHTDISNYEYLPLEGYAVHKSAAGFVDRSRREKATRENCFHLVRASKELAGDRGRAEVYLRAVMGYLGE